MVWVHSPEGSKVKVMAMVTERVGRGVAFMPFHFGGHWPGEDLRHKYPTGADPYVLGESSNTAGTYGYDVVTGMQASKTTLCHVEPAKGGELKKGTHEIPPRRQPLHPQASRRTKRKSGEE